MRHTEPWTTFHLQCTPKPGIELLMGEPKPAHRLTRTVSADAEALALALGR